MNTVDVIVVLVVVLNGIIGAYKGFVWQALRLGSIILGFYLAGRLGPGLADWTESWVTWDATGRRVIAYVVIFALTYVLVSLAGHLFRKWLEKAHLTSTDRSLGFVLGSAKGMFLIWLVFYFLFVFSAVLPDYVHTQLKGDEVAGIPRSKSFLIWNRWIREHQDALMPDGIRQDHAEGGQEYGK